MLNCITATKRNFQRAQYYLLVFSSESRLTLVLSAGVVLFHAADAAPTSVNGSPSTPPLTSSPPVRPSMTPLRTPSQMPFPQLSSTPDQVLKTFCDVINRTDLNVAREQYAKRLQKERTGPPPLHDWIKMVHGSIGDVSDT